VKRSDRVFSLNPAFLILFFLLVMALPVVRAAEPLGAGIELSIPNETVPPGGMLQLKMQITEPKPISKGGQKTRFQAQFLGQIQGIALFSRSGDASGTALLSKGGAQLSLNSPLFSMGDAIDYPILTMAMPVKATAIPGQTAPLTLDSSWSQWTDDTGKAYPVVLKDGMLTVGGTLSIANIVPGGGVLPAGTKVAILGTGFKPDAQVQINEAKIFKQTVVSSSEIDVILAATVNLTSKRVRVVNKSTNENTTYYSYQRTTAMGKSKHALIGATVPLFSQSTWTTAYFKPVLNGSQFSGVALANLTSQRVKVILQLFASDGSLLKSYTVQIPPSKRFSRDLAELFVGVTADSTTSLKVSTPTPISMLGLLGDDTLGTVEPVDPSAQP
jgi:hypothetical protein